MRYTLPNLQALSHSFCEEIIKLNILQWEQDRLLPRRFFEEAGKIGLLGLETPAENGGMGGAFIDKLALAKDMSGSSMAATFALINSQNIAARLNASDVERHRIDIAPRLRTGELIGCTALTEPHAGSDFAAIKTRATKVGGGWSLSGSKAWITNSTHADIVMLYAQTDPEKGWKGIASFLIDARNPGFRRGKTYNLIGGHSIGAGELHLESYFAPDDDMLAAPGDAFKIAMSSINGARTYVAAMCVGMIEDALRKATCYAKERQTFGTSLINHQGLTWSLVDVAAQLESLTLLTREAGEKITADEDAVRAAAIAKKIAGEITVPALTTCIQAMGANGLLEENLLGHHLACAKIAGYTDGSTEMMNDRIGRYL